MSAEQIQFLIDTYCDGGACDDHLSDDSGTLQKQCAHTVEDDAEKCSVFSVIKELGGNPP
jgi:hypothetical protein